MKMISKRAIRKPTAWTFVKPRKIQTERPIGCAPPPPVWPAKPDLEIKLQDQELGEWWVKKSKAAEEEVCGILGLEKEDKEDHLGRGEKPRLRRKPLVGPISKGEVRGTAASDAWR